MPICCIKIMLYTYNTFNVHTYELMLHKLINLIYIKMNVNKSNDLRAM